MDQQIATIICAAILSIALIASYIHCKRDQNEIDAQAHPSIKETIAEASGYFGTDADAAKGGITEALDLLPVQMLSNMAGSNVKRGSRGKKRGRR